MALASFFFFDKTDTRKNAKSQQKFKTTNIYEKNILTVLI